MASLEASTRIVQLKVRLLGLSPMIWRRVLVPESVSLRELHGILLQTRTRALDGALRGKFEQWYPGLKNDDTTGKAEQLAA